MGPRARRTGRRAGRALAAVAAAATMAGCAVLGTAPLAGESDGPVTLRFQSLAFQDPSVAATERIVADWNAQHPEAQVELVQGSWDSVHDQLVTQFQGGTAPDVIHNEAAAIAGFARQGYLADLTPHLSLDTAGEIPPELAPALTVDGRLVAAPTLLQSYVVFANLDLLDAAGVAVPDGPQWTWDELAAAARATTTAEHTGLGWGLRQPTATVMSMALGHGGVFFDGVGPDTAVRVGEAELAVPRRIRDMALGDRSLDAVSLTQSGSDVLRSFLAGRHAMVVAGSFAAQQITEAAPGFRWAVLPPLAGTSPAQAANPQTLSVSAQSRAPREATRFIEYYLQASNLAAVAQGEWLVPAVAPARTQVATATGGADGWAATLAAADTLTTAPFQTVPDYPQWKDRIATPALQRYLAGELDDAGLVAELERGWEQIRR